MDYDSSEALPSVAMSTTRVVAFGYDRMLMELRSRVLRMSGYEVEETFTMAEASESAQSDLIDALVICHTVPIDQKEKLVSAVRKTRKLMPIFCVRAHQYDVIPGDCAAVENSPIAILDSMREAVRVYKSPKTSSIPLAS
jgi:hemoglobin-like flavoprotein